MAIVTAIVLENRVMKSSDLSAPALAVCLFADYFLTREEGCGGRLRGIFSKSLIKTENNQ